MVIRRLLQTIRQYPRFQPSVVRWLTGEAGSVPSEGERVLIERLREKFPGATDVVVQDISGGCGAMFEIYLETPQFKGKRTVIQHRMVNEALATEIAQMHGLRITTAIPKEQT